MTKDPELILIEGILAGDRKLYTQLVNRHQRFVFTITYRILKHKPEAEEAAQDTFIKAFHHLRDFNRQSKFSTWLYRIAFNTAISFKRKHRHQFKNIDDTVISTKQDGESNLEKTDKRKFLQMALSKLTEVDRTALTLFYWQEFTLDEMAEILNIGSNTLKVRIHRARQRVADELTLILNKEALTL
jgi:RNA polymerase sigma-70 factor (ECF subfamily)